MATETIVSDRTSATHEQIVKKEKSEAIAQMIDSLANEDEDKHDTPEDAQGQADPSSKPEGDETKTELATVKDEKSDDSPSLEASAEDKPKHDVAEDAQTPAAPISKTEEAEGDEKKAEPDIIAVQKTSEPVSLGTDVADNPKKEKELIPALQTISVATEPAQDAIKSEPEEPSSETTVNETPQQPEKESAVTVEKKQPKTADIHEASAETIEKPINTAEANPVIESEAKVEKEAEILEAGAIKEEKPVAAEVQGKTEEPEKDSQEKPQEAEQPSTFAIPEPSAEATEKPNDAIDKEKTREPSAEANEKPSDAIEEEKTSDPLEEGMKKTNDYKARPTEAVKAEPVVTEVEENPKEPEKQSLEQKEEEQPDTVAIPEVPSTEASEAIDEKTREPDLETEVPKETKPKTESTETEKAEPEVTKVDENPSEPEKQSFKQEEEEQPKVVIPEIPKLEAETADKPGDIFEAHPPKESDIEVVKEISNSESEAAPGQEEKPDDIVVVNPPEVSDIEVAKHTSNSEIEAVPDKEEKPEPMSIEVEEKPRDLLEVVEEVGETSKDLKVKQEIVPQAYRVEGTSIDTIKEPISLKKDKCDKEEVTSIPENTAQVSLNEEDQEAPTNVGEPSPEVAEKIEEDGKKEPGFTEVTEGVSKEVAGVIENPDQDSIDHEAKTDLKEEREYSAPINVVENVAVTDVNNDKEPEAPEAVQVSSREAEVEIKKVEEQNEAKTESVKEDRPAVDNEKEAHTDTKVDEISSAISQPVRETLASKFEEEESAKTGEDSSEKGKTEEPVKTEVQVPEPPTKESDATKTTKDLPKENPAKPAQKQSNNIISKVKQSLVKAKKAITGKSPSSKNHSEAKDDIKVKFV